MITRGICAVICLASLPLHLQAQVPTWALAPELRIGSVDDPTYSLTEISDVGVGKDGSIYVAQPQESVIKVFDASGKMTGRIGSRGAGPGEFQLLHRVGWIADTLYAVDRAQQRVSLFSVRGKHIQTLSLTSPAEGPYSPGIPGEMLAGGLSLIKPGLSTAHLAAGRIRSAPLLLVSRAGAVVDTVASLSWLGKGGAFAFPGGSGTLTQPISTEQLWRAAPDGQSFVIVDRPAAVSGASARFRVTKLSAAGDTVFSHSYSYTPQKVSADLINHLVRRESQRLQKLSGGRIDADWDAVAREALSIPNYHPPVSELVVGRDGRIWLRREETTDDAVTWNVFDEQGKLTAMLRAPKQIKLYQADRGYAWGVEHDELDVPYIVRYRVTSK